MFKNRQSRRRFRLGNLARLVQLRQSVSHQPQPPRTTLQETLSHSPPQSPPAQPPQPPSSTLRPEPKSSQLLSPLSPKSNEEPPSQPMPPLMSKHRNLLIQSPPQVKTQSSTLNATEEFQSQPSPPFLPIETISPPPPPALLSESGESQPPLPPHEAVNETQFRPSLSDTDETQPLLLPPERKTPPSPPSTQNSTAESQSQPLTPSKSIQETRVRSPPPSHASPPSLSESGESQLPFTPPEAKTPPSTPSTENVKKNSQPHLPLKSIDEPRFRSPFPWQASQPSLSNSGESQPSLPPEEGKTPPSMLTANKGFQSQTPPPSMPSKSIAGTQIRSLPPSLSESDESQTPPEAKIPPSQSSTLNAIEESQSQSPPPFKSIDETRFQSPVPSQKSLPNSVESQSSVPPSEAKNLPSSPPMLNANEDFQSETSPPISPPSKYTEKPKSIPPLVSPKVAENLRSQSPMPAPSLTALRSQSPMKTPIRSPAATIPAPPLSPSKSPPLLSSKIIDGARSHNSPTSPPSKPKSIRPLLSPKPAENFRSQSPMPQPSLTALTSPSPMKTLIPSPAAPITAPPLLSSPLKSQIIPSPEPSLPQTIPNQIKFSPHTSPDHKKDLNYNPDKLNAKHIKKIPTWNEEPETGITGKINIKNRRKAKWSEKKTEPMMMMFINSNVQGFNTSLSLDSSSIDHEPGVHLTIDSDQSCEFSSKVFY